MRVFLLSLLLALVLNTASNSTQIDDVQAAEGAAGEASRDPRWTQFTRDRDMLASNDTRAIWVDENALWFGGENGFSHYSGLWSIDTNIAGVTVGTVDGGLSTQQPLGHIQAFARDGSQGILWAGSSSGLLLQWSDQRWSLAADLKSPIYAMIVMEGELWIGSENGLYRYNSVENVLVDALGRQPVFSLLLDDQSVWAGSASGLWRPLTTRACCGRAVMGPGLFHCDLTKRAIPIMVLQAI
jgi:ligand-binding sensor domain-containing protein